MRFMIALVAAVAAVAASQIAITAAAQGDAVVSVVVGQGEPAREWAIQVAGGTASTDHLTLAPSGLGFEGDFTVAVASSKATVTLTAALPADSQLATVGCVDDRTPPTEMKADVDGSSFTLDVASGRGYRCIAISGPAGSQGAAQAPAAAMDAATRSPLPRSDASTSSTSGPGWPVVVLTLAVILGMAFVLRPIRR